MKYGYYHLPTKEKGDLTKNRCMDNVKYQPNLWTKPTPSSGWSFRFYYNN